MESMIDTGNTSGQDSQAIVPDELRGWNWGAFLMNWIWAIGNKTWWGLLALLLYGLGLIMSIVLGVKGNEWAWQNRKWESVEQFKATQRVLMLWGVGILIATALIAIFAALLFPFLARAREAAMMHP